jgi:hypothetical protein
MAEEKKDSENPKAAEQLSAALPIPSSRTSNTNFNTENALVRDFVEAIKADAEVRKLEEINKGREIDHAHEYSKAALTVMAKDRDEQRLSHKTSRRDYLIASGIAVIFLFGLLALYIYTGNIELAKDIVKIGGSALVAGVSGYFYGKSKASPSKNEND